MNVYGNLWFAGGHLEKNGRHIGIFDGQHFFLKK
jgi:hypothetical protein